VTPTGGGTELVGTLSIDRAENISPAEISPDLSKVALRVPGRYFRIAQVDGSGSVDIPLSPSDLSWSPDSRYLAIANIWNEIYVVREDGSDLHKVADGQYPSWSPDGSRIVFVAFPNIAIVNRGGTGLQTVWRAASWSGPPAWSPGGDLLAFPTDYAVKVVRLDGTLVDTFNGSFVTNIGPTWSSDGTKLAIRNGGLSIFDIRTRAERRFPHLFQATWAPGSDLFADAFSSPCSWPGIHVASASSGKVRRLTLDCRVDGTAASETLEGSEENDLISGRRGADRIFGYGSADTIHAGPGNDWVTGGPYAEGDEGDYIDGGPGKDVLEGGRGQQSSYSMWDDVLLGRAGSDVLRGGPGFDILSGGTGNDTIHARDGVQDRIKCGPGHDVALVDKRDRVAADCETVRVRKTR
jgi:Ca2+-binding RTX toxin-like protein